jgi:hypothetical protein
MSAITPGVCQFCGITDAQVDGDKVSWLDSARTCCNGYPCRRAHFAALAALASAKAARQKAARPKKLASWQVHERILEERRVRRRASRERKKGRAA